MPDYNNKNTSFNGSSANSSDTPNHANATLELAERIKAAVLAGENISLTLGLAQTNIIGPEKSSS